jgi:hypothetical protein
MVIVSLPEAWGFCCELLQPYSDIAAGAGMGERNCGLARRLRLVRLFVSGLSAQAIAAQIYVVVTAAACRRPYFFRNSYGPTGPSKRKRTSLESPSRAMASLREAE